MPLSHTWHRTCMPCKMPSLKVFCVGLITRVTAGAADDAEGDGDEVEVTNANSWLELPVAMLTVRPLTFLMSGILAALPRCHRRAGGVVRNPLMSVAAGRQERLKLSTATGRRESRTRQGGGTIAAWGAGPQGRRDEGCADVFAPQRT